METFLGDKKSVLYQTLKEFKALKTNETLWIDLSISDIKTKSQDWIDNGYFLILFENASVIDIKEIRAVIPAYSENWDVIYKIFCIQYQYHIEKKIPFIYLVLTNDPIDNEQKIILFIKNSLNTTDSLFGLYEYVPQVYYNDMEEKRAGYAKNIALKLLNKVYNLSPSNSFNERFLKLREDFGKAFKEYHDDLIKDFLKNDVAAISLPASSCLRIHSYGRTDFYGSLLENFSNAIENESYEDLFYFSAPVNPIKPLFDDLYRFEYLCFCFISFDLSNVSNSKLKKVPIANPPNYCTPDITDNMNIIGQLAGNSSNTGYSQGSLFDQYHTATTNIARSQIREQIHNLISQLSTNLTNLILETQKSIRDDTNIYNVDPKEFQKAYLEFLKFLESICSLLVQNIWGMRRFFGLRVSYRVKSPFFARSRIVNDLNGIILRCIQLLNIFQFIYHSLKLYNEEKDAINSCIDRIFNLTKSSKIQYDNIKQELNVDPYFKSKIINKKIKHIDFIKIDTPIKSSQLSIENAIESAESKINETTEEIKTLIDNHINKLNTNRSEICGSNGNGYEIKINEDDFSDLLKYWVPAFFNTHEAFQTSVGMLNFIQNNDDFMMNFRETVDLDVKDNLLYEKFINIKNLACEKKWQLWKKQALKTMPQIFMFDPLRIDNYEKSTTFPNPDEFILEAIDNGFFNPDNSTIKVNLETFNLFDEAGKIFFFESNTGLFTFREFTSRLDSYIFKRLCEWILWVNSQIEIELQDSPDNKELKILKQRIERNQFQSILFNLFHEKIHSIDNFAHEITEIIKDISLSQPNFKHGYYGMLSESPRFLLKNCLDPALMRLFRPYNEKNAVPREFNKLYLIYYFQNNSHIYQLTKRAFIDYCLSKDVDIFEKFNT
ncbi:MAG: hypothetical protein HQK65_01050 [Desulfamplus sp.]|nr:hypothetical protein [Desulfamplus sp.]